MKLLEQSLFDLAIIAMVSIYLQKNEDHMIKVLMILKKKLRRDEPGAFCYYKTWSDQKSTYNSSVEKADVSYCGFNVDNYSWWNKRKGDAYYKNLFDKLKSIDLSKYTCHVSSNWRSCKSFADNNIITKYNLIN